MKHLKFSTSVVHAARIPVSTVVCTMALLSGCTSLKDWMPNKSVASRPTPSSSSSVARTLNGYHWQLQRVTTAQGVEQSSWKPTGKNAESKNIQLNFSNDGVLSVQNLCNQLAGRYTLDGNRILVDQLVSTMRACSNRSQMALEQRVVQRLSTLQNWQLRLANEITPPILTLGFEDGDLWELQGNPTPATIYGNEGVREFIEVAAQRERCSGGSTAQCLKVRTLQYDSQGLKTEVGPWRHFQGEIEGYYHQPGVRNVLRVQRYEHHNPSADAAPYVYILDIVVESDAMKMR